MCLVTEEEASEQLCVALPYVLEDRVGTGNLLLTCNYCTASDCKMGWRYIKYELCPDCNGTGKDYAYTEDTIYDCFKCDGTGRVSSDKGYCGLAGKPE